MYGSRAMLGATKRAQMVESNPYFAASSGSASDGYKVSSKRPRTVESMNPYFTKGAAGSFYQPFNNVYSGGAGGSIHTFPVVRLRGLPFDCEEPDIHNFFAGLTIVDCLMVSKDGRFSGEAFAVFSSPMQTDFALRKDRQNMGHRYIEVFRCGKEDYYHAVAAEVNSWGASDGGHHQWGPPKKPYEDGAEVEYTEFLKLRGLPYSATESDIVEFFGEFELREESVRIARRPDGRATGEAYVEFPSAEVARGAMRMDRMMIGSRYVELFPSDCGEAGRAAS